MDLIALAPGVRARLFAGSAVNIAQSRIGQVRESLTPLLSASLLKQCDDQTLIAIHAIRMTLEDFALESKKDPTRFSDWGVIAAPDRPGRKRLTETISKFHTDGAWSVTPHFIPHCMLHSLPGLVSQAFRLNGPILGVAPGDVGLTAAAWMAGDDLPGAWLVWTSQNDSGSVSATVGNIGHCPTSDAEAAAMTGDCDPRAAIRRFRLNSTSGIA
jgi:hypothetical protein